MPLIIGKLFRHFGNLSGLIRTLRWQVGVGVAFGPNINDWTPKTASVLHFVSVATAKSKKTRVSQVERDMIDAMAKRYNGKAV